MWSLSDESLCNCIRFNWSQSQLYCQFGNRWTYTEGGEKHCKENSWLMGKCALKVTNKGKYINCRETRKRDLKVISIWLMQDREMRKKVCEEWLYKAIPDQDAESFCASRVECWVEIEIEGRKPANVFTSQNSSLLWVLEKHFRHYLQLLQVV